MNQGREMFFSLSVNLRSLSEVAASDCPIVQVRGVLTKEEMTQEGIVGTAGNGEIRKEMVSGERRILCPGYLTKDRFMREEMTLPACMFCEVRKNYMQHTKEQTERKTKKQPLHKKISGWISRHL